MIEELGVCVWGYMGVELFSQAVTLGTCRFKYWLDVACVDVLYW